MKAYQKYWPQRNGKPVSLEWMRLTNKVLRAFPNSPRQKALQAQVKALEQRESGGALRLAEVMAERGHME